MATPSDNPKDKYILNAAPADSWLPGDAKLNETINREV